MAYLIQFSYLATIWWLNALCTHIWNTFRSVTQGTRDTGMDFFIRWVSVVEFHDGALSIGKVFGQESTVVKWNYQILGLCQVTVRQKLGVILVIKCFKNWSQQKMLFTKKVHLNWYSSMKNFLRKIRMIFDIENSLWKSKIGTFWRTATGWRPKIW